MIDLHLHTTSSDGSDEPQVILNKAAQAGLRYISITDHDSMGAYGKLKEGKNKDSFSGTLIPGCEFSVVHNKMPIEVLGYGIDFDTIAESGLLSDERFLERENQYINKMKGICKNLGIKMTDTLSITSGKPFATQVIHRDLRNYPENEEFFTEEIWGSINAFYRTCINNEESPFFLNQAKDYPTVPEIADLIKRAGGKSFLAHLYGYFAENHLELLDSIVGLKALDGIECYHSLHDKEKTEFLLGYCKDNGLLASGGSDYHGTLKPSVFIGESIKGMRIPFEILAPWLPSLKTSFI
ncbi:MAG: metal-dependent phosphoesterase [Bacillota bacterium]|jgi:predicted metal-dependent phosphoesterase TrpH|nr:metal-dependent phosphoesterase [Bacillota bacterium]